MMTLKPWMVMTSNFSMRPLFDNMVLHSMLNC